MLLTYAMLLVVIAGSIMQTLDVPSETRGNFLLSYIRRGE
jgi:hypothetical protein